MKKVGKIWAFKFVKTYFLEYWLNWSFVSEKSADWPYTVINYFWLYLNQLNSNFCRWSYGVVLWEITTLGGSPYPGIPPEDLFTYISNGYRMSKPDVCPNDVYDDVMAQCWLANANDRPESSHVANVLERMLKKRFPVCIVFVFFNTGTHEGVSSSLRVHFDSQVSYVREGKKLRKLFMFSLCLPRDALCTFTKIQRIYTFFNSLDNKMVTTTNN